MPKTAAGFIETVLAINTGITLEDIAGDLRTPAVGDVVVCIDNISGPGTISYHATFMYEGVA